VATLQEHNGSIRVRCCDSGKRETFGLGKVSRHEADSTAAQVVYLLIRIEPRFIAVPAGVDIVVFSRNGGKTPEQGVESERAEVTLGALLDRCTLRALEDSSAL
jgi:hypothetical protein